MSEDCRILRLTTVHENGLVGAKSCVFNKISGYFQGRSDRFLGEPELAFGDDGPVHRHNSLDKSCFSGHFHDRHLQDHGMTRVDRNEEPHLVDAGQDQVLTLFYAFARESDDGKMVLSVSAKILTLGSSNIELWVPGTS